MTVRVHDRGARRLVSTVRTLRADKPGVEVGVLGAEAYEGGITVAQVAEWAEFGLGQPQRSWLRAWVDNNRSELDRVVAAETRAIVEGRRTQAQALDRLGLWIQGQIQQRIANGIAPPNAESTIDHKGSSTPLIDTGQLRSSITYRRTT